MSNGSVLEARQQQADELACKLAYECAWRLCDDALKTLESQRTRAVALLSLTIVAAGIVASSLLRANIIDDVGAIGVMGMMAFGFSTLVVMVCAAIVAWPLDTETALRPSQIIANYVNPHKRCRNKAWIYRCLARDMETAYDKMKEKLNTRYAATGWQSLLSPLPMSELLCWC